MTKRTAKAHERALSSLQEKSVSYRKPMKHRCKIQITVVSTYDAEYECDDALARMIESLQRDPMPGNHLGMTAADCRIRIADRSNIVEKR